MWSSFSFPLGKKLIDRIEKKGQLTPTCKAPLPVQGMRDGQMPLLSNNHTYLQMAGAYYIHLVAPICQKVYSDYPLLDECSALLPVFHSASQEVLTKWMERYNTLHNQYGNP